MDAVWSIILTVVCVAIGLLSERKKKPHATPVHAKTPQPTAARSFRAAAAKLQQLQQQQNPQKASVAKPLPLPQEGEHIVLPTPTADDINLMSRKKMRDEALRRHYTFWRRAVANQTILNKNQSV